MSKRIVPYCTLLFIVFSSTLLAWLPFILSGNFQTILSHFDGPLYIIPAKTAYNPALIQEITRDPVMPQNPLYYAAHLPLYPFFIWVASSLGFGFTKAMLLVTVLSTVFLAWLFYTMLIRLKITNHPILLTASILFVPRFLVLHTVGSPEPLFMLFIIASLYFFEQKKYALSGIAGALAVSTKLPGILLFPAYMFTLIESHLVFKRRIHKSVLFLLLIPVALVAVFALYHVQYGNFFAYFNTGATVPMPYPLSVFSTSAQWVGTAWLEDVWFYFMLYVVTIISFWRSSHRSFFYFCLVFLGGTLFVQHRDIARYSIPLLPFAFITFQHVLTNTQKGWHIARVVAVIVAYAYAWNFMASNVMPITEWSPFL